MGHSPEEVKIEIHLHRTWGRTEGSVRTEGQPSSNELKCQDAQPLWTGYEDQNELQFREKGGRSKLHLKERAHLLRTQWKSSWLTAENFFLAPSFATCYGFSNPGQGNEETFSSYLE